VHEELKEEFIQNQRLNLVFASLTTLTGARNYIMTILREEKKSEALSRFMTPLDVTSVHGKFFFAMLATLIDFGTMHFSSGDQLPTDNLERTFWVQSAIPMLKYFARITSLMEASSGDTVELIATAEEVLKTEAAKHGNASFSTFIKLQVLIVHTVKNVMTLSSVSLYEVMELKTVDLLCRWRWRKHQRCIKILEDKQLDFHHASFRTISNIKIIAIHTVQNIITLSTISITGRRRYRMAKVRTAEVPINWYHRQEILIDQRELHKQLLRKREQI
jgi:hypothetical protein